MVSCCGKHPPEYWNHEALVLTGATCLLWVCKEVLFNVVILQVAHSIAAIERCY